MRNGIDQRSSSMATLDLSFTTSESNVTPNVVKMPRTVDGIVSRLLSKVPKPSCFKDNVRYWDTG